jgi:hypothetical protein
MKLMRLERSNIGDMLVVVVVEEEQEAVTCGLDYL